MRLHACTQLTTVNKYVYTWLLVVLRVEAYFQLVFLEWISYSNSFTKGRGRIGLLASLKVPSSLEATFLLSPPVIQQQEPKPTPSFCNLKSPLFLKT